LLSQDPFLIHLSMFTTLFGLPGTIFDTPIMNYIFVFVYPGTN